MEWIGIFAVIIDQPLLALIPAVGFAIVARFVPSRLVWTASGSWFAYALYELAVWTRLLCSGECNIRVDLLLIAPVLLLVSVLAVGRLVITLLRRPRER